MRYLWQPIQKLILVALSASLLLGLGQTETAESGRLPTIETIAETAGLPTIETVRAAVVENPPPQPLPEPAIPQCIPSSLHVYPANLYGIAESVNIENVHITFVYFVPSDQVGGQYSDWQEQVETTAQAFKNYFAREFSNRLNLSSTVYPAVVLGDHALAEYDALETPSGVSMFSEITGRIGWSEIKNGQLAQGRYPVLMVYYHTGFEDRFQSPEARFSTFGWLGAAFLPAFHLEEISGEREIDLIVSAHEFAHLLGIPHPWEMNPAIEDEPTNLMGYQAHGTLLDTHIGSSVKEAMGRCPN